MTPRNPFVLQEFFTQIFVQHMASKNPTMVGHWQTKIACKKDPTWMHEINFEQTYIWTKVALRLLPV